MIAAHDAIIFSKEKLNVKKKVFFTTSVGNAEYGKVKGKGKKFMAAVGFEPTPLS